MKAIFMLLLLVVAVGHFWQQYQKGQVTPEQASPYVVVYGRDTCGYTTRMKTALAESGVPFEYRVVDTPSVADTLHQRMQWAGLETRRYNLPVVEVSGHMEIRPEPEAVASRFSEQVPAH